MKKQILNYIFNATSKTLILPDFDNINLEGVLLITNVTDNIIIYNFADSTNKISIVGDVITFSYDTSLMADTDKIQIFYEDGIDEQKTTITTMLKTILMTLLSLPFVDKTLNRVRSTAIVESGTITTVSTVGNIATIDTYQGKTLIINMNICSWAEVVRRTIS